MWTDQDEEGEQDQDQDQDQEKDEDLEVNMLESDLQPAHRAEVLDVSESIKFKKFVLLRGYMSRTWRDCHRRKNWSSRVSN